MAKVLATDEGFELCQVARGDYHVSDKRRDKWAGRVSGHIFFDGERGQYFCPTFPIEIRARDLQDCWMMTKARAQIEWPEAA